MKQYPSFGALMISYLNFSKFSSNSCWYISVFLLNKNTFLIIIKVSILCFFKMVSGISVHAFLVRKHTYTVESFSEFTMSA